MTCLDVRDRLAEHALGVLAPTEARDIERHLDWCAGCRKEFDELREGLSSVALSLPLVEPAPSLESRVVEKVQGAAGTRSPARRQGIRALAVATLAAVLVAIGAVGWAVVKTNQSQDVARTTNSNIERLQKLFGTGSYQATLQPTSAVGDTGGRVLDEGRALIYSAPGVPDLILVDVFVPHPVAGPYTVKLVNKAGGTISGGELRLSQSGELIFWENSGLDLSKGYAIMVMDRAGQIILTGLVHPLSSS